MKLFESLADYDEDITTALREILSKDFNMDIDEKTLKSAVSRMSLSDILEIDTAIENGDKPAIEEILNKYSPAEYAIPGRTNITSAASKRAEPAKTAVPVTAAKSATPVTSPEPKTTANGTKKPITSQKSIAPGAQGQATESLDRIKKLAGL